MNYKDILEKTKRFVISEGRKVVEEHKEFKTNIKEDGVDISTTIDDEIEKRFYDFVQEEFPDYGFFGEEKEELREIEEYTWYVDPIDGTKWFKQGVPLWTMSFALVKKGEYVPKLGIVYNAVSDQIYTAYIDGGAYMNDEKLDFDVDSNPMKVQAILDLTAHKSEWGWDEDEDKVLDYVKDLSKNFYRLRNIGNGSMSLCWLSQSMFGLYINPYLHNSGYTDIAAGLIIASEAGCKVEKVTIRDEVSLMLVGKEGLILAAKDLFKN